LIHTFVIFLIFLPDFLEKKSTALHLTQGSSVSLYSKEFFISEGFGRSKSEISPSETNSGNRSIDDQIEAFKNSISYPELALEQGLEDDCTFRVTVAENGQVEKLVVVAPCKYNVFDSQIRSQLRIWKFNVSKGTDLVIPIRFRIHARE